MKTLIAYASKTGTAEKCARMLAERLPDATLCDLCKEKPDPGAYDQVIVGGGVRMGALHVDARQYLDGCKPILLQKRLGLYLCAGFAEKAGELFENNVDPELRAHALACDCFGGEIDLSKLRGFEKLVTKMALRSFKDADGQAARPRLLPERVEAFAAKFREA